jgi:multiple sugar transport system ATP-binding protein
MSAVIARDIVKQFGDVPAVNGISLTIPDGEFMVLLGPSGCGKTTFLRIICGLETQTSGDLTIGGTIVNELPPRARGVAMMFQSYGLYPHYTVRNNIAFPLKTQRVPREKIAKQVEWASQLLGINHLLDRRPRQLSGGERQRVALARALVREPTALLLDEPLSNLDAKLRTMARQEIKQFQTRVGLTTIYVTHDQVEAMGMGDRIAVIDKGKIRQVGTPR